MKQPSSQPITARNILVLSWRGPDHPQAGGSEVYLSELIRHWQQAGANIVLLCAGSGINPLAYERRFVDGCELLTLGNRFTVYLLVAFFLLFRGRRFDAILDTANGIPFFSPLFTSTPTTLLVHHVHRTQWALEFSSAFAALGWFIESKVVPLLYRNAPVSTVSETSARDLQELGVDRRQIWIIRPGCSGPGHGQRADETLAGSRGHRLLYVGRLKHYKRVSRLVLAVDQLRHEFPDISLDIVGRGPEREQLETLITSAGLERHVTMHGFVDEQTKQQLYVQATVFATASEVEGWGMTVIEANSYGVPVVAYDVPGLSESVRDGETGLLVPADAPLEAFSEAIGRIMRDTSLRDNLTGGAVSWAKQFDWSEAAADTLWVFENGRAMLEQRRGHSRSPMRQTFRDAVTLLNQLPGRPVVLSSFAATSIINYAFGLIMAALLLPGDFGLLAFAQTVLLLAGLILNSGYAWSLTAALPGADRRAQAGLVRGALRANVLLSLVMSLAIIALFAAGPLRGGLERWSITLLIAGSLPFLAVIAIGRGAMRGTEAFGSMGVIQVSEVTAKLLGGIILVAIGLGSEGAVAGFLIGSMLAGALSLLLINRELGISILGEAARIPFAQVGAMFAAVLGMSLLLNLDILAVKLFSTGERALVGHYQSAIILANIPYFMTTALLAVLFPQLAAVKSLSHTVPRLAETLRIILLFIAPIALSLAFVPEFFPQLFFPDDYIAAAPALRLLAFGNLALILVAPFASAFQATGHARIPAVVLLMIAGVEALALRLLVPVGGAMAAAGLFGLSGLTAMFVLVGIYLTRIPVFNTRLVFGWLARYLLSMCAAAVAAYAALYWTGSPSLALLVAALIYGIMLRVSRLWSLRPVAPSMVKEARTTLHAHTPPGL